MVDGILLQVFIGWSEGGHFVLGSTTSIEFDSFGVPFREIEVESCGEDEKFVRKMKMRRKARKTPRMVSLRLDGKFVLDGLII